jgi:hypothetical protein
MSLTKKDTECVQHFWTTDIKFLGLVKKDITFLGKNFYTIHDLRTGFLVHMEDQELYAHTINRMIKGGVKIFNSSNELPIHMNIEEHQDYIKNLIENKGQ